jgi:hypothetical protein
MKASLLNEINSGDLKEELKKDIEEEFGSLNEFKDDIRWREWRDLKETQEFINFLTTEHNSLVVRACNLALAGKDEAAKYVTLLTEAATIIRIINLTKGGHYNA